MNEFKGISLPFQHIVRLYQDSNIQRDEMIKGWSSTFQTYVRGMWNNTSTV